jgi:predicted nucleic-acid-binding Zn-ribbon protein
MFKGINAIEFNRKFYNNDTCYEYLMDKKWGKGFQCLRCGHGEAYKGKTGYHKRCKQCGYDQSVTANTVFHGMRMPLLKAFHMIFRLTARKKGMSTVELGAEVGVEQKTAWLLKRKLQAVMNDRNKDKLDGDVEIDEMLIGGYTEGKAGRNLDKKTAVMIGIEKLNDGRTGNINFELLENFEALTMKYAMLQITEPTARIKTDNFTSYQSLKPEINNLETVLSAKGSNFKELHKQIMMFKNWLRGTHHKCSKHLLFAYLDEYKYRFNKRNMRQWIFDNIINRMMHNIPHPYPILKTLCAYST